MISNALFAAAGLLAVLPETLALPKLVTRANLPSYRDPSSSYNANSFWYAD